MSKARLVITALFVEHQAPAEVAARYGVHRAWVYQLKARYEARARRRSSPGPDARRPPHRDPARPPSSWSCGCVRSSTEAGLDAGADTIAWHLHHHHSSALSRATINRILARAGP